MSKMSESDRIIYDLLAASDVEGLKQHSTFDIAIPILYLDMNNIDLDDEVIEYLCGDINCVEKLILSTIIVDPKYLTQKLNKILQHVSSYIPVLEITMHTYCYSIEIDTEYTKYSKPNIISLRMSLMIMIECFKHKMNLIEIYQYYVLSNPLNNDRNDVSNCALKNAIAYIISNAINSNNNDLSTVNTNDLNDIFTVLITGLAPLPLINIILDYLPDNFKLTEDLIRSIQNRCRLHIPSNFVSLFEEDI